MSNPTRQHPLMYGLSNCGWCRKARIWLEENLGEGHFDLIYVDLVDSVERDRLMDKLGKLTPRPAFPMILADGELIVGYDVERLRKVFKK